MLVQTAVDAVGLIADWAGRRAPPPATIPSTAGLPAGFCAVVEASDAWGPDFYASDRHSSDLLTVQDRILRPENLSKDDDGVTLFINENQGVWAFGFKDNAPDELWVTGDWNEDAGGRHPESWRPLRMRSENALIYTVLVNGFFGVQSHHQSTEDEQVPEATNTLVWRNPAFVDWAGFWTNTARTMLHFSGFGLTLSRQDMS